MRPGTLDGMRLTATIDPDFSEAERSALRLDGDCFGLGLSTVPADLPVGADLRAASLLPAVARYDLVVDTWAAAWVHGAAPALPSPLTLAVDVRSGRRTRAVHPAPREARYRGDEVRRRGGVLVTEPLRTALDLARFEPAWTQATAAVVAGLLVGVPAERVLRAAASLRLVTGADRLQARLRDVCVPGSGDPAGRATPDPLM